jgi:hypothetical protein
MDEKLPHIVSHLQQIDCPLQLISLPWFLCFFVGYVPLEIALRIFDTFFYEGPNIFFTVAVTIFKLNENMILGSHDVSAMLNKIKGNTYDWNRLIEVWNLHS